MNCLTSTSTISFACCSSPMYWSRLWSAGEWGSGWMASPCLLPLISVTMFGQVLFYNNISNLSIYITCILPFSTFPSEADVFFLTDQTYREPFGCSIFWHLFYFSGFYTSVPNAFASSLIAAVCFNCIFYSVNLSVIPQHSASAAHYVLTGRFFIFYFLNFTLPPQLL